MNKNTGQTNCPGPYHGIKPAPFRFCPDCGRLLDPIAHAEEKCVNFHTLRKSKGYRFCPDCGEKLSKTRKN